MTHQAGTTELTIEEFILKKLFPDLFNTINSQSHYLKQLQGAIDKLSIGQEFIIRDLIPLDWKKMGTGAALKLGRQFKKMVDAKEISSVSFMRKAPDNSTIYIKK